MRDERNNTGDQNTGDWNTGRGNTGDRNTGDWNTGRGNTGDQNTGDRNTGRWNAGHWNTGHWNTGDRNTGDWNTGRGNTGRWNAGDRNTGCWNTGHWNTGHRNTGDQNTGHWNTGDRNTGDLNTHTPALIDVFNKPLSRDQWQKAEKPLFLYNLSPVITDKGGRVAGKQTIPEAFQKAWADAPKDQRDLFLNLPNFDALVAADLFGMSASDFSPAPQGDGKPEEITIDGAVYKRVK